MKSHPNLLHALRNAACIALSASILLPLPALPATVNLATAPLANATTTSVLPNLLFVLDTSGSMGWNYLPDYVNDSLCLDTNGTYGLGCTNQPLFQSADFNGVYYNPAITYLPATNADGTDKASQVSPWTSVKNDAFNSSSSSTNLVTGYVDVEWCTNSNYTDCLRNDNYILPGTVNGKTYTTMHTTKSSGTTGSVATGAPDAPTTATRTWGPHYYTIVPGEYCDSAKLTNCQASSGGNFTFPAKVRWCKNNTDATSATTAAGACQGIRTGSFTVPRFPTKFFTPGVAAKPPTPIVPAVPASVTFSLSVSCNSKKSQTIKIAGMTVGGTSILTSATAFENTASALATDVNGKGSNGYTVVSSGSSVTVTAPVSAGNVTSPVAITTTNGTNACSGFSPTTTSNLSGYTAAIPASAGSPAVPAGYYGSFVRTDIVPGNTYTKAVTRTDCAANPCTYAEEMTNFANWWTYYQTRIQTMKTSVSRAFKAIDDKYRVGFIDIWGNYYLPINKFAAGTGSVKEKWYTQLFGVSVGNGTPLRSALVNAGRLFAGFDSSGNRLAAADDPVQYSCQQNFTLMTTDGYWNTDADSVAVGVKGAAIGDMDGTVGGVQTPRPKYEGPTATSNTLADIAKYYYDTDLRNKALWNNCTGNINGVDVCSDADTTKPNQHMTTFTLGLGVNGAINYTSDYKTATSGDFHDLATGSNNINWPVPVADTETAVDDLWHAAVNGGGTYFSAKDPTQLVNGLNSALAQIDAVRGAGAAAATSTLNPVTGDNAIYQATYTTVKWIGNLEQRAIDPATGAISKTDTWCVENTDAGCVGVLPTQVGTNTDSRKIWISDATGKLTPFTYTNLSTTQQAYFSSTFLSSNLSQWSALSTVQQTKAQGDNLVNYLRGQTQYDGRVANVDTVNNIDNRLFRLRDATLGDVTESQPAFVGKPQFSYTDAGYAQFITDNTSRAKTVYVGANDGMLHAFDAATGTERWAYVPKMVIPNLWTLADNNYATKHANYVNGSPIIGDIYVTSDSKWHTILVAGLNGGGRGYYALDITDPTTPKLLWEIDQTTDADIGYSFGQPVITKKSDGTWVVLLTSGYNNTSPGTGQGVLFVRDAYTGVGVATATGSSRISDNVGTASPVSPSGLAKIATWADSPEKNNTAGYTYGGDLNGNVWRFDINAGTVFQFAILKDSSGNLQPVTTQPVLASINGVKVVYVATGKYLEVSDLQDTSKQSIYAMKDDNATTTLVNPRTVLVQQTFTASGATRTVATSNSVNFTTQSGWFVDFPDSGERVNTDPTLDAGLLFVPTIVPSSTVCTPGGYGWFNYFDYRYGTNGTNGVVSQYSSTPIVGVNNVFLTTGKRYTILEGADGSMGPPPVQPPDNNNGSSYRSTRVIWRELIPGH
ncbi:MAG: PilC/PilY family type IV pilus protein [Pseudomonadota bacterium]